MRERSLLDIVTRFGEFAEEVNSYPHAVELAFESFDHLHEIMGAKKNASIAKDLAGVRARLADARERRDTLLHCHLAMGLWSAFEAAVNDFVVEAICLFPDRLDVEKIKSIRLPASEAFAGTRQLAQRVVDEYRSGTDGFGRANALMSLVGVSFNIDAQAKRRVLELQQRRNVIAHRGSVVDKRAVEKCPWLACDLGQRVSIEHRELRIYALHLTIYLSDALHSLGESVHGDAFGSGPVLTDWREMAIALEDPTHFRVQDW